MSFVLVTADFPEIGAEEFNVIFSRLEQANWIRMHDHSNAVNTLWFNGYAEAKPEEAIKVARHNFTSCCIPYCIPRLSIEWGATDKYNQMAV